MSRNSFDGDSDVPTKKSRLQSKTDPNSFLESLEELVKNNKAQKRKFTEDNTKIVVTPQGLIEKCHYEQVKVNYCYVPMFVGQSCLSQAQSTVVISVPNQDWANIITTTAVGDIKVAEIKLIIHGKGNPNFDQGGTRKLVAVAISEDLVNLLKMKTKHDRQVLSTAIDSFFNVLCKGFVMESMSVTGRSACSHEAKLLNLECVDADCHTHSQPTIDEVNVEDEQETLMDLADEGTEFSNVDEIFERVSNTLTSENASHSQSPALNELDEDQEEINDTVNTTLLTDRDGDDCLDDVIFHHEPGIMFRIPGCHRRSKSWAVVPTWNHNSFLTLQHNDTANNRARYRCASCIQLKSKNKSLPIIPLVTQNELTGEWLRHPCFVPHFCEGISRQAFAFMVDERRAKKAMWSNAVLEFSKWADEFAEDLTERGRQNNIPEEEIQARINNIKTNKDLKLAVQAIGWKKKSKVTPSKKTSSVKKQTRKKP